MYGKRCEPLSFTTVTGAHADRWVLVFFWAPNDADQGFLQKIFYIQKCPLRDRHALALFGPAGLPPIRAPRTPRTRAGHALLTVGDPPLAGVSVSAS